MRCYHELGVVVAVSLELAKLRISLVRRFDSVTGHARRGLSYFLNWPHVEVDVHVLDGSLVDILRSKLGLGRLSNKI